MTQYAENVLILGAGVFQVPLIKKTKEMGYKALVASINGDYPGIPLSDQFFEADTTNVKEILAIAEQNKIKAILTTGTDVSIPTLSAVVDKLSLIGPSNMAASIVSSKTKFRSFLKSNAFNCPSFIACNNFSTAWRFCMNSQKQLVIKPDDASGSRGVSLLKPDLSKETINEAFKNAQKYAQNDIVCIEEFVDGVEVGGDAFILDGEMIFFTTTHKHMDGILVKGHSLPGSIAEKDAKRVEKEVHKVANALGYLNGPLNFDVIISPDKTVILEMGLRNGGNGIIDIIDNSYGVDLIQMYLDLVIGNELPKLPYRVTKTKSSSLVFGSKKSGQIVSLPDIKDVKDKIPEIINIVYAKKPGDIVDSLVNNANLIGYCVLNCGFDDFEKVREKIDFALTVKVE